VIASGPSFRTLALLTRSWGAKRGANDHRHRATSGHAQPLSLRQNGTPGHGGRRQAVFRECLLSSRSRVRVAVGALSISTLVRRHFYGPQSRSSRDLPPSPCPLRARWLRGGPAQLLRCLPAQLARDGLLPLVAAMQVHHRGARSQERRLRRRWRARHRALRLGRPPGTGAPHR
jgi:hypothetical protein